MDRHADRHIALVTLVVDDYDRALACYRDQLGFTVRHDQPLGHGKRWLVVAPTPSAATALLLAQAAGPDQRAAIGHQTAGRVCLFLHTDDFVRDHTLFTARGIHFLESPRHEPYGTVAVFEDCYGNRWDLIQPT